MEGCSSLPQTTCMHPYCSPLLLLPPLKLSFCRQAAYQGSNRWLCHAGHLGVTTQSVTQSNIHFQQFIVLLWLGQNGDLYCFWLFQQAWSCSWRSYLSHFSEGWSLLPGVDYNMARKDSCPVVFSATLEVLFDEVLAVQSKWISPISTSTWRNSSSSSSCKVVKGFLWLDHCIRYSQIGPDRPSKDHVMDCHYCETIRHFLPDSSF